MSLFTTLYDCFKCLWPSNTKGFNETEIGPVASLHDGTQVPIETLKTTLLMLDLLKQQNGHVVVTFDLYEKALNPSYKFSSFPGCPDSGSVLKNLNFLNQKNALSEDMASVIRNCFKHGTFGIVHLDPLTGKALGKDYSWKEYFSLEMREKS